MQRPDRYRPRSQPALVLQATQAGKHLTLEKPIALDLAKARAIWVSRAL
jgi:predicted dehydrogenase